MNKAPLLILALVLCAGCMTVPPRPAPPAPPPGLAQVKLGVGPFPRKTMGSIGEEVMRPALEQALAAAGLQAAGGAGRADAWLDFRVDPKGATFTPYHSHLTLRDAATNRRVAEVDYVGGAIGSNFNARNAVFTQIADSIAANLVARLLAEKAVAEYAAQRSAQRAAAPASGGRKVIKIDWDAPDAADSVPAEVPAAPSAESRPEPAPAPEAAPEPEPRARPARPTREQAKEIDSQL